LRSLEKWLNFSPDFCKLILQKVLVFR